MQYIQLIITNFDSLENNESDAEYNEEPLLFCDDTTKTAHSKCSEFISTLQYRPYLGWNKQVYPKFNVKKCYMR